MTMTGQDMMDAAALLQPQRDPPWTPEDSLVARVCGHAERIGAIALKLTYDEDGWPTEETKAFSRRQATWRCRECRS